MQQHPAADASAVPAIPKSLLEQMQELLASVTADLAELQSSGARASDRSDGGPSLNTSNGLSSSEA
ncbi:hypothetical protein OG535_13745 [Kitasatospora sp. NBC_00085]